MNLAAIMHQLQRSQAMLQSGQAGEAWLVLAPLRAAIDRNGQALRLYALVASQVGQIDDAASALRRIAELEGNPPEIIGGLADMLGKAGRHGEALVHWSRLAALHPELADAHLNRAIAAGEAGQHALAVEAAEAGLERFPGHARLLAAKAMALKNAGRIEESVTLFDRAVAAEPARALTRHNQAVALRAACRFDEACEAYAEAERLGMKGASFFANWAAAELEAGHVERAESFYGKALADEPRHDEARKGLTRLRIEYRAAEGAFAHYEEPASGQPKDPMLWFDYAQALAANRQMEKALEVAERGLAFNVTSRELRVVKSFAQGMVGDAAAALAELETLLEGEPVNSPLHDLTTQIALRAGRPEQAARVLEQRVAQHPEDQLAWAMLGLAWRLIDDPREHWLCDYDRFVMLADVPAPDGGLNMVDYAGAVAATLDRLHMASSEPGDQTLRGGTQTSGSLFARPDPAIQRFREAVTLAARDAVAALPDDPHHPFLKRKSARFGFSGSWSVRLAAGGHHVSHVHPEGWMSSAYYARLPASSEIARSRHEGCIQFGVPPEVLGIDLPPRRIIEPRVGQLVLFPSYVWHGTIPFSAGDRLTAAFDYLPL